MINLTAKFLIMKTQTQLLKEENPMQILPRVPRIENKYSLTISDIRKLRVNRRDLITPNLFWWNSLISAWFITGSDNSKSLNSNHNDFWITIYDINAPRHAGKFTFNITRSNGVHQYFFEEFYNPNDIESVNDLIIQEKFLSAINHMIDIGILVKP